MSPSACVNSVSKSFTSSCQPLVQLTATSGQRPRHVIVKRRAKKEVLSLGLDTQVSMPLVFKALLTCAALLAYRLAIQGSISATFQEQSFEADEIARTLTGLTMIT